MSPQSLLLTYQRSGRVFMANVEDLTHEQSLMAPHETVNCINWLAGHLVATRFTIASQLGQSPVWDEEARARYKGGSPAITADGPDIYSIEKIVADFTESQARIEAGLNASSTDALAGPSISPRFTTVGDHLLYLNVHEIHHLGPIMVLRELLGKPSVWA